jgi:hypothetical protein
MPEQMSNIVGIKAQGTVSDLAQEPMPKDGWILLLAFGNDI